MIKGLLSFNGRYRILHLTWFAFFLTFICWFNFAPFATTIGTELHLEKAQISTLAICNVALTIPARIIIGMLLDRFGPRITYLILLIYAVVPCLITATAHDFNQLVWGRLLMGIAGSGFVVGIRMVSEWFPPKEIGSAQGIYGGWGNFGAAAAEFGLPIVALSTAFLSGNATNWRLAIALSGIVAALYGLFYYNNVQDTPTGKVYKKPKKNGAMEVTSVNSFVALCLSNLGLILGLALLTWRLAQPKIHFINQSQMYVVWVLLTGLYAFQSYKAWQVNREMLAGRKVYPPSKRYEFRQVALLNFTYFSSFGSELAVVSMLPTFFENTFTLNHVTAALIASSYPLLNFISRPSGGYISDRLGSRKWTLTVTTAIIGFAYLNMSLIRSNWAIPLTITACVLCAAFVQGGCGATFGMAPLIKKEITGQIAGSVGAYGNLGGVVYLTVFSLTNAVTLFQTMGVTALICSCLCTFFLKEPRNSFASEDLTESQGLVNQNVILAEE
ncbi:MAG: NarK family nitrate/nitrite MFS transporter [Rhizonema sp. PD38]|nr:NarK family nitrate/nitrite MFS transporter [Rhizonema sp. PD38]